MQRRLFLQYVSIGAAALTASPAKLLACISCHDFNTNDDGYKSSVVDCEYPLNCFVVGPLASRNYLDSLHPGIFLRREAGSFKVTEVLSYSPASLLDAIRPGDRILAINGFTTKFHTGDYLWDAGGKNKGSCLLEFERAGNARRVSVPLRTVRSLLDEGWRSRYEGHKREQGINWVPVSESGGIEGAFSAGVKWWPRDTFLEVSDMIVGSPAHRSGLEPGDRIASIEGKPVAAGSRLLLPGSEPAVIRIEIEREDGRQPVDIEKVGLSTLLHSIGEIQRSGGALSAVGL